MQVGSNHVVDRLTAFSFLVRFRAVRLFCRKTMKTLQPPLYRILIDHRLAERQIMI